MLVSALNLFETFLMPKIHKHALVMHSADKMYALVNDVASYAEFLPDCHGVKIISSSGNELNASLLVGKGGVTKWFTTHNTMHFPDAIDISLVDGPFKKLTGRWQFNAIDDELSKVVLDLEFEFSNKIIALAFGSVFSHMANNMVRAFTQRADEVYPS